MPTPGLLRDRHFARFVGVLGRLGEEMADRRLVGEILDSLCGLLGAERVFLFRFRKTGGFRVLMGRNLDGEDIPRPQEKISHHAVRRMEMAGTVWAVPDARQDRRYRTEDVQGGGKPPKSIVIFPLEVGGDVVGGLYADHRFQTLGDGVAEDERVRVWISLCAVAVRLREQGTRLRLVEKKLAAGRRGEEAADHETGAAEPRPPAAAPEAPRLEEFHGLHSANPDVLDQFDNLRRVSSSTIPVLIYGETGVGKSHLARAIHEASTRASSPFETVGCGSLPPSLMESELLGHVKGAFTGAEHDHTGVFVRAHGGTLLLDEVGDLAPELQTKLLRALEDGRIRPLGSKEVFEVDVRVVSTTSRDLERLVGEERFRRDLYFRLKGLVVEIPPLRERREDIPGLLRLFFDRHTRKTGGAGDTAGEADGKGDVVVDADALELLLRYPWPGNVRELENEVRRLAALGCERVTAADLSPFLRDGASGASPLAAGRRSPSLEEVVSAAEKEAIASVLRRCGGNKSRAADELGITRKALYRRLKKYGIA